MKKVFIAMAAIAAMASSCTKEEIVKEEIPLQESEVHISMHHEHPQRPASDLIQSTCSINGSYLYCHYNFVEKQENSEKAKNTRGKKCTLFHYS